MIMLFWIVLLAALGLILGSFVNAWVWRLHGQEELRDQLYELEHHKAPPKTTEARQDEARELRRQLRELSMSTGRSMCSKCRHPLAPIDLVPLLSWLWLRGKCRYCHRPIQDNPLVEAVLPLLFVLSYIWWPWQLPGADGSGGSAYGLLAFGFWLVFLVAFMALAVYDIRWYLLPDRIVWPLVALALVQVLLHAFVFHGGWPVLAAAGWGVVIDSGLFLALYYIGGRLGREWIGFGDVKLGIILGLLAGGALQALLVLYIASLTGLLASLPRLLRHRIKMNSHIPFGPFLLLGSYIVMLAGPSLAAWLTRLLAVG